MPSDTTNSAAAKLSEGQDAEFTHNKNLAIKGPTMEKLPDLSNVLQRHEPPPNSNQDALESDSKGESESDVNNNVPIATKVKRGPRGPYREYSNKQWNDAIFDLTMNFGSMSVTEAANKHGINPRTARAKFAKYMEDPSKGFPVDKPRGGGAGRPALLQEEHTKFILEFFGEDPAKEKMQLLQDAIKEKFGLEVSESTLYRHVKKNCSLSLQRRQPQLKAQSVGGNKEARKT